jgi:hypothetical protein
MSTQHVPPPPPSLNGGLYTGEPFQANAPWANVPATPDAVSLMMHTLQSANPPPGARYHVPGATRPGNNLLDTPNLQFISPAHSAICVATCPSPNEVARANKETARFAKYAYWSK